MEHQDLQVSNWSEISEGSDTVFFEEVDELSSLDEVLSHQVETFSNIPIIHTLSDSDKCDKIPSHSFTNVWH